MSGDIMETINAQLANALERCVATISTERWAKIEQTDPLFIAFARLVPAMQHLQSTRAKLDAAEARWREARRLSTLHGFEVLDAEHWAWTSRRFRALSRQMKAALKRFEGKEPSPSDVEQLTVLYSTIGSLINYRIALLSVDRKMSAEHLRPPRKLVNKKDPSRRSSGSTGIRWCALPAWSRRFRARCSGR